MNLEELEQRPAISHGRGMYGPEPGAFSPFKFDRKGNKVVASGHEGWYGCRELFLSYSFKAGMKRFLFSHYGNRTHDYIKKFIAECEERLGLPADQRSQILPTNNVNFSVVCVSDWWRTVPIRKALFTILLRAGQAYNDKRTFEQALYSNEYATDTQYAIERFFKGYTLLKGKNYGWVENFEYKSNKEIDKRLVKSLDKSK